MSHGTAYSAVKALLQARLQSRLGSDVAVSYQAPVNPLDVNSVGSREAVWFGDAEGTWDNVVFTDGGLRFDETILLNMVVQVLGKTDLDDQLAGDERAEEIVHDILAELAGSAFHTALTTDAVLSEFDYVIVTPAAQRWGVGRLGKVGGAHAAACELGLEVRSRFS